MPEPFSPYFGFGIKDACRPCLLAIVLTTSLNVMILSAADNASSYWKSISCCAGDISWWDASMTNPISSIVNTMSRLAFSPKSNGPRSKYVARSWEIVVGTLSSSIWNKKNSHSGPTLNWYPISFASSITFFSTYLGSLSNGVPSALCTSQISLATLPCCGLHGKISNVFRSG